MHGILHRVKKQIIRLITGMRRKLAGKVHQDMTSEPIVEKRPPGAAVASRDLPTKQKRPPRAAVAGRDLPTNQKHVLDRRHLDQVLTGQTRSSNSQKIHRSPNCHLLMWAPQKDLPRKPRCQKLNLECLSRSGPPGRDMRTPMIRADRNGSDRTNWMYGDL